MADFWSDSDSDASVDPRAVLIEGAGERFVFSDAETVASDSAWEDCDQRSMVRDDPPVDVESDDDESWRTPIGRPRAGPHDNLDQDSWAGVGAGLATVFRDATPDDSSGDEFWRLVDC